MGSMINATQLRLRRELVIAAAQVLFTSRPQTINNLFPFMKSNVEGATSKSRHWQRDFLGRLRDHGCLETLLVQKHKLYKTPTGCVERLRRLITKPYHDLDRLIQPPHKGPGEAADSSISQPQPQLQPQQPAPQLGQMVRVTFADFFEIIKQNLVYMRERVDAKVIADLTYIKEQMDDFSKRMATIEDFLTAPNRSR